MNETFIASISALFDIFSKIQVLHFIELKCNMQGVPMQKELLSCIGYFNESKGGS
jgi:hypothetical protein